jgi:hypothetical protein
MIVLSINSDNFDLISILEMAKYGANNQNSKDIYETNLRGTFTSEILTKS